MKKTYQKNASIKKAPVAQRVSEELDIPIAFVPGAAHIEVSGNSRAIVSGCKGVLEYNDCLIKLNMGQNIIKIIGTNLSISALQLEQATIGGEILTIEFSN